MFGSSSRCTVEVSLVETETINIDRRDWGVH